MNRRNRFLIGLLSAAATFGALYAFAGEARWHRGDPYPRHHYHRDGRYPCCAYDQPAASPINPQQVR